MDGTPYISSINLIEREPIKLASSSVLVLVGPNNAGKTYFLKALQSQIHGANVNEVPPENDIFSTIELSWRGDATKAAAIVESRIDKVFQLTQYGYQNNNRIQYKGRRTLTSDQFHEVSADRHSLSVFTDLFLEFDDAIDRVQETELQQQVPSHERAKPQSLAQQAHKNKIASDLIVKNFRQIFHKEISYYNLDGQIGFLLAPPPENGARLGDSLDKATMTHFKTSPKLWNQGLGMRSVLGLLLKIFSTDRDIILIDEPEAFLHHPQAAALGQVLADISTEQSKQIIVATHDRNLLSGLLKNGTTDVSIQRLTRQNNTSKVRGIQPSELSNVRTMSLIRYTPIFDSLFARLTVLVENEKDAYFYSEALEYALRKAADKYPSISIDEILFVSTNGLGAMARTAELINSIRSKVVVACDLDLLSNRQQLLNVLRAVTEQEMENLPDRIDQLYGKLLTQMGIEKAWDQEKRDKAFKKADGIASTQPDLRASFEAILNRLDDLGVILNPVGELEDFAKDLVSKSRKAEWVQNALQGEIHKSDQAQKYAERILQHLQIE